MALREFGTIFVNDAKFVAWHGFPNRMQLIAMNVRCEDADPATFGNPVGLVQLARPTIQDRAFKRGRHWRAPRQLHPQRGNDLPGKIGVCHQPLVLHSDEDGMRHKVLFHEGQIVRGLEFLHQNDRAASGQALKHAHQRQVRVEWRARQQD